MTVRNELLKSIRQAEPYVPGEQPRHKVVKLNTNENPYPPSPRVAEALRNADADALRLYPDPEASALTEALAEYYGVEKDQVFAVLLFCFVVFCWFFLF